MLQTLTFGAMKNYLRILRFARPYWAYAVANAICNALMILFSLASISVVIPLLNILFDQTKRVRVHPGELESLGDIKDWAYFYLSELIAEHGEVKVLAYVCVTASIMFFFKNFFRYMAMYALAPLRNGVINDIRSAVHRKSLQLPIFYFTEKRKGDTLSRMSNDVTELQWSILTSLEMMVRDPLMILGTLAVLLFLSPQLTLFMFVILPITGLFISIIGKSLKRSSRKAQGQVGYLLSIFEETMTGLRILKAFRAEDIQGRRFDKISGDYSRTMNRVLRKNDLSSPLSEFLGATVMFLIIWFGGQLVLVDEQMDGALLIGYVGFFYQLIPSFKSLSQGVYNIQKGTASAERIIEILDAPNPITEAPDAVPITEFKDRIRFANVNFRYSPDGPPVLKDINFDLEHGKTIALVGASGSGKTTISNLLPRFWDVTDGHVEIDGVDIRHYRIGDLRSMMGIVNQESILFNDTIASNISLGKPGASPDEIRRAAEVANAHEFIERMEGQYDAGIGEGGSKLSGGQRQRMSIARAVLEDPPILILDEATSSLDTESERLVQDALNKLMTNRTSLIIAHRLSTIQHADEILVMDAGRIVERGTHDDLLAADGTYAKLVNMQSFQ